MLTLTNDPIRLFRAAVASFLGLAAIHVLLNLVLTEPLALKTSINDLILLLPTALAALMLYYASQRSTSFGRRIRAGWRMLAFAFAVYSLGDLVLFILNLTGSAATPSEADIFFLPAYPLFIVGVLWLSDDFPSLGKRFQILIDISVVMIAAALIAWLFVFAPTLSVYQDADLWTRVLALLYPVLDLFLFFVLVRLFFGQVRSSQPPPYFLLAGAMTQIISDTAVSVQALDGTYQPGGLPDTGYVIASALVGLAGVAQAVKASKRKIFAPLEIAPRFHAFSWSMYLPFLAVIAAYILLIGHDNHADSSFPVLALIVGVLILLTLIRQAITLRENRQLFIEAEKEIAERKKIEEELRCAKEDLEIRVLERTTELAAARARLQHLLAASPIVIYSFQANEAMSATFVSENVCTVLGYTPEQFIQKPGFWFDQIHPDDVARVKNRFASVSTTGQDDSEYRFKHAAGGYRWVRDVTRLIRDETGNALEIVGAWMDITEQKRTSDRQRILYNVLRAVSGQLDMDRVARSAVETIVQFTGYPHVCLAVPNEDNTRWVVLGAAGSLAAELGASYGIHQGVIGRAFKTGRLEWVRDVVDDPGYVRDVQATDAPALRSEVVALMQRGDHLFGALNVESDRVDAFDSDDVRMIQSLADLIALALENARLYEQAQKEIAERKRIESDLRYYSMHDPLTRLYNRAFFEEEFLRLRGGRQFPVSIIVADVDGLKSANDLQGHSAGDDLLRRTATVLREAFRAQDVIARIGGDEFAVLMPLTSTVTVEDMLERCRRNVARQNVGQLNLLRLSLGAATAESTCTLDEALKQADTRMYEAKAASKGSHGNAS